MNRSDWANCCTAKTSMHPLKRRFVTAVALSTGWIALGMLLSGGMTLRVAAADIEASGEWSQLPGMPVPRWEAGTVILDDKLFVFGGYEYPTKSTKRVDVFDPRDGSWQRRSDLPSSLTHMNTVVDGRSVWFAGGFKDGYKGHAIDEVWRYDVDADTYTAGPSLPAPRGGGGLALVGRRLHYVGGLLPDRVTDSPDHWVLDLEKLASGEANWTAAAPLPAPRNQFGAIALQGKVYVLGGQFGHDRGQDDQARVDIYDPSTDAWTRGDDLPGPHSHAEGSTFLIGERIVTMGGMTRKNGRRRIDDEIWTFTPSEGWRVAGPLPAALSSPVAAVIGGRLYLGGGSPNGAHPQPKMWVRPWSSRSRPSSRALAWTGWLGPRRDGFAAGFEAPAAWPKKLQKRWSLDVGAGYGTPVVANGLVYVHSRQGDDEVVRCVDLATGDVRWKEADDTPFTIGGGGERHGKGPKSCPVLADGRLFTLSITGVLSAWSATNGDRLWSRDYAERFGKGHPYWGAATSPIVDGNKVIAHLGTDEAGVLVALDVESGEEVWAHGNDGTCYSSPLIVEIAGVRQVVEWNHRAVVGVNVETGRGLWEHEFPHESHNQNMPTPVFYRGSILAGGENRGVLRLDPSLDGDEWKVTKRWHQDEVALDMSTAVVNGEFLYGLSHYGRGRLFCLDIASGEIRWQGPGRTGENVMFLSIPGQIVALTNSGELRIVRASAERYEAVASYDVAPGRTWAPPVLLGDRILTKDHRELTCWSLRK